MTRVIDGDTIEARFAGRIVDVRLIGVDTPETVHPFEPVECLGPQSSRFTTRKLETEHVRLEMDAERRDQYDRTLAYIWVDGTLFNKSLVAHGFATVATYEPNTKYVDRFERAEDRAKSEGSGIWGACTTNGGASGGGGGTSEGGCEASYPDFCIPPPPPDLDCAQVDGTNFSVVGADPHGFDGDGDGVGCES